ncbi:hypothetical protein [Pigmentibacter ruber]|uniref:hypothetical protein n=1 Tax=Pigmentibacter ruber TaxID=2683196 RepID=UPI00131CB86F|nr:hypothetical protein [Pigmentibacter ruber]
MRKNVSSLLAAFLSFVCVVIGLIKLLPHFNKNNELDHTWVVFVTFAFPLMTFVYAIAGANEQAKSVAPNGYGLVLSIPTIIAAAYLGSWIAAVCMLLVTILIFVQLLRDLKEEESNNH